MNEATYTWSGHLPPRSGHTSVARSNSALSCKIFLGGVPWDISEAALALAFKNYGNIRIEWPGKEADALPKGYLYVIFEHEKQVTFTGTHFTSVSFYLPVAKRLGHGLV